MCLVPVVVQYDLCRLVSKLEVDLSVMFISHSLDLYQLYILCQNVLYHPGKVLHIYFYYMLLVTIT